MITVPTVAELGTELPLLSDFALMTGAKVLTTPSNKNEPTVNEPTRGLVWARDGDASRPIKGVGTGDKRGVIMNPETPWVGVMPSWTNPGAAGFDVAETKKNGLCLTHHGLLVYYPQRAVADKMAQELSAALHKAERSRFYALTEMRKVGKYSTPWLGDNSLAHPSYCYAYHGKCYVNFIDRFNFSHWYHCEPLPVVANEKDNTLRTATALFAACYDQPSNEWVKKHEGVTNLEWFLNRDFLRELENSVNYVDHIKERAAKRRYCLFEPRGWKRLRNVAYTANDFFWNTEEKTSRGPIYK